MSQKQNKNKAKQNKKKPNKQNKNATLFVLFTITFELYTVYQLTPQILCCRNMHTTNCSSKCDDYNQAEIDRNMAGQIQYPQDPNFKLYYIMSFALLGLLSSRYKLALLQKGKDETRCLFLFISEKNKTKQKVSTLWNIN